MKKIIPIVLIVLVLTGCSKSEPVDIKEEVNKSFDKQVVEFTLDTTKYAKALEQYQYVYGFERDIVENYINENSDVISDGLKQKLLDASYNFEQSELVDDMTILEPGEEYNTEETEENLPIIEDDLFKDMNETDGYENGYAIISIEAYPNDTLIASVNHWFLGTRKLLAKIDTDGKILDITVYV